jgi:hypothetical protein
MAEAQSTIVTIGSPGACLGTTQMLLTTAGIGLLLITVALFYWGVPKNGQPSRVPDKWGLGLIFPILLLCTGIFGIILLLKGLYP